MGSFDPVTAAVAAISIAKQRANARAQERAARAQADQDIAALRQRQGINDRQRAENLKRALSTQRARFGALGVGTGGSAQAVLDGLSAASDRDRADESGLVNARIEEIDAGFNSLKRRNLLERRNLVRKHVFGELRKELPILSLLE